MFLIGGAIHVCAIFVGSYSYWRLHGLPGTSMVRTVWSSVFGMDFSLWDRRYQHVTSSKARAYETTIVLSSFFLLVKAPVTTS